MSPRVLGTIPRTRRIVELVLHYYQRKQYGIHVNDIHSYGIHGIYTLYPGLHGDTGGQGLTTAGCDVLILFMFINVYS